MAIQKYISLTLYSFTLLLYSQTLIAQRGIASALGAITTDYLFTSNDIPIEVTSQWIIKAPTGNEQRASETILHFSETYFLEFETVSNMQAEVQGRTLFGPSYVITFYNERNEVLGRLPLSFNRVKRVQTEADRQSPARFYGIDLRDIPLLMLEQTHRIDIVQHFR